MVDIIEGQAAKRLEEINRVLKKAQEEEWSLKGGLGDIRDSRF